MKVSNAYLTVNDIDALLISKGVMFYDKKRIQVIYAENDACLTRYHIVLDTVEIVLIIDANDNDKDKVWLNVKPLFHT